MLILLFIVYTRLIVIWVKKTPAKLAFIGFLCFCGNNFLTVVVIAIRAYSMRKLRLVALWTS